MKRTIYHQLWVLSPPPPVTWNRRDYYLSCRLFFLNSFALFILSLAFFYPRHPLILYWSHISNFYQTSDCARKHGRGPSASLHIHKGQKMEQQCAVHCACTLPILFGHSQRTLRENSEIAQRPIRDHSETTQKSLREHEEKAQKMPLHWWSKARSPDLLRFS